MVAIKNCELRRTMLKETGQECQLAHRRQICLRRHEAVAQSSWFKVTPPSEATQPYVSAKR